MAAILIVLIVFILLFFGGSGTSFEEGYSKLQSIESKYGVSEEQLTPATEAELDEFESELNLLKNSLGESSDEKALKLLIGVRLDLIAMERKFLQAKEKVDSIDHLYPDCSSVGDIAQAKKLYDEGIVGGRLALEKSRIFLNNYPEQAQKAEISSNEDLGYTINGLADSIEFTKSILDSYCP